MTVTSEQVWAALGEVFDPENGMSIVELGLVYGIDIHDDAVHVTMTLTTAGCPPTPRSQTGRGRQSSGYPKSKPSTSGSPLTRSGRRNGSGPFPTALADLRSIWGQRASPEAVVPRQNNSRYDLRHTRHRVSKAKVPIRKRCDGAAREAHRLQYRESGW